MQLTVTQTKVQLCSRMPKVKMSHYGAVPQGVRPATLTERPAVLQCTRTLCGLKQSSVTSHIAAVAHRSKQTLWKPGFNLLQKLAPQT